MDFGLELLHPPVSTNDDYQSPPLGLYSLGNEGSVIGYVVYTQEAHMSLAGGIRDWMERKVTCSLG